MTTVITALDKWLEAHPYLKEAARFQQTIEDILSSSDIPSLPVPQWEDSSDGFEAGLPLLNNRALSEQVMEQAEDYLELLVSGLTQADCPEEVHRDCVTLDKEMKRSTDTSYGIIKQVAEGAEVSLEIPTPFSPGLAKFLGWRAMERVVRPWREALESWLTNAVWSQAYCPLCGEKPAMAQLVRTQKGRQRFLSCGCCRTKWGYMRTACAFCGSSDQSKLEIFELDQEKDFRLDVCHECNGYIKTYINEGDEDLMLADWSTLHLDVLAAGQGLKRCAHSLYEA
jgi:FdhE protein